MVALTKEEVAVVEQVLLALTNQHNLVVVLVEMVNHGRVIALFLLEVVEEMVDPLTLVQVTMEVQEEEEQVVLVQLQAQQTLVVEAVVARMVVQELLLLNTNFNNKWYIYN